MEDNKLTEFEQAMVSQVANVFGYVNLYPEFEDKLVRVIRQIMPPICTPNQRKFLDEIRSKGEFVKSVLPGKNAIWLNYSCIRQSDFESNLSELVEKKDE